MKRYFLLLPIVCLLASCEAGWDSEYKDMFHQACVEEATWATSDTQRKTYCDCVLEKAMKKYPELADALEHMNELSTDSSIQQCRTDAEAK